jgi:hypothetical protein
LGLKNISFFIVFLFLILHGTFSAAQQADSIQTPSLQLFSNTFADFILENGEGIYDLYYDSSLTGIQFSSPVYKYSYAALYTGNMGGAVLPSVFLYDPFPRKYYYGMNQFDVYDLGIAPGMIENKKIYTSLAYQRGTRKEQYFMLKHRQHFGRNLMGGLDFGAGASQGFYSRQLTALRNFDLFGLYETPNHRYRVYGKFIYNKTGTQENGGLFEDSTLRDVSSADARTLPVRLKDAERTHKEKAFYFQQQLFIFKPGPDTAMESNTSTYNIDVTQSFHFSDKGMVFEAATNQEDYFQNTYFDTLSTFDSTHTRSYFNDVKLNISAKNFARSNHWFDADVFSGSTQESFKISQRELDTLLTDVSGYLGIRVRVMDVASLMMRYNRSLNSTVPGGEKLETAFLYNSFTNFLGAGISFVRESRVPALFEQMNLSNHFIWFNQFDNEEINRLEIKFSLPWWKFYSSFIYQASKNYIYYNDEGIPQSYASSISNIAVNLSQQFDIRHFHVIGKALIQTSDVPEVMPLPRYTLYISYFYEKAFFKHALLTQLGTDLKYNDQYYSPYYQPATGQFILQDEKEYGGYLFVDVFLNFKVKTASFFFKIEHLNAGWNDKNYIILAHYPMQGRMFKFGVSWSLFD